MANHYDPQDIAPVQPAPPVSLVGANMAFIDSEGVYQECVVRSLLDGYAWVQKTSGKLNTVPVSKLISRKTERELFIDAVKRDIAPEGILWTTVEKLWDAGYRKVVKDANS